jgi:hypothetical protein
MRQKERAPGEVDQGKGDHIQNNREEDMIERPPSPLNDSW